MRDLESIITICIGILILILILCITTLYFPPIIDKELQCRIDKAMHIKYSKLDQHEKIEQLVDIGFTVQEAVYYLDDK